MNDRIRALRRMAERDPDDPRPLFAIAVEQEKLGRWNEVAETLRAYLRRADDEGNAWGRLARALRELGRDDEAREAYEEGIAAAHRHGHPTMAAEFEDEMDAL